MTMFWIILVSLFFIVWLIRLLYYLGDERRRFRIVETRNNEFRVEKMGLIIQIWWRAMRVSPFYDNDKLLYTYVDFGHYSEHSKLDYAQEAVDAHFKEKEINKKDKEVVNVWTLNDK